VTPKSKSDVFVYLAAVTGLPFGLGMAAILQESLEFWAPGGAVFGVAMAAFGTPKLVGDTQAVQFTDRARFIERLNVACSQIGYHLTSSVESYLRYDAGGDSSFSIGPIKIAPASYLTLGVQVGADSATLVGPHQSVESVVARLRTP
jgi:hypothetical protein